MLALPEALAPFAAYRQFILYRLVPSTTRPGKTDKFPIDYRTGAVTNAHDPAIWLSSQEAIDFARSFGDSYGVGFVFTAVDPFWFLDIDAALSPTGEWSSLAVALVGAFTGAAVELSSSCKGLHIFGTGAAPLHACKNTEYNLEFYTEGRFVALTGVNTQGSAATDCTELLPRLIQQFFPPTGANTATPAEWTNIPCDGWNGPTDDAKLLERAMRSQSARAAFGTAASFRDLFECNVEVLAKAYPPHDTDRPYDASSVDRAIAQHLAFWTGKDCERIKRIMLSSALVRPKWERDDYLYRTILGAVGVQVDFLTDKEPEPMAGPVAVEGEAPTAKAVEGSTFLSIDQQVGLFRGCVYITDIHRVLVPGGMLLKPDQFRVLFGGYSFPMDFANERTSRDAWEAFTQSQAYRSPRADGTCFKPDRLPGEIIKDAGRTRANVWWPVEVPRMAGDASPFITHLHKILPNDRDALILLSYMAACVQYKGVKFQWAPLLQGVEGNGKTLFTRCVAEAVGHRYTHMPPANEISEKFNSWLFYTIFIGVEDIYVPDHKREIIEILKPMITSENLAKRAMNTDQVMNDVVCNFMFNSNHRDAVRKTRNDRRFCIMYSAQQNEADLLRDGLTNRYFQDLYKWMRNGGYAIVSELLHTFPIPDEFNPATTCQRAPITSSTEEAIEASLGSIEQEILEAIDQGLPGFAGGFISSIMLENRLNALGSGRRIPINKRRDLLASLGYEPHAGLPGGRVNNTVLPDGGKPRLFIKKGHPNALIVGAAEVARAYTNAQVSLGFSNML